MNYKKKISINDCTTVDVAFKVSQNIRERRSIYADEFIKRNISDELLNEILTNATWAPTHKMTEPWRFIVFRGKYLKEIGNYLADYYKGFYYETMFPDEAKEKYEMIKKYPLKSACVIGVVMVRNIKIGLPEWEEIAAVSSAVQNMALSCTAHQIGNYWSTSKGAIDYVKTFGLAENEKSLGLFYMGYYSNKLKPSIKKRTPISKKVTYYE